MIGLLREGSIACWSANGSSLGGGFDALRPVDIGRAVEQLGCPCPRTARQVHGIAIDRDGSSAECDAFLLRPGESALVRHADCFPVVVADPIRSRAVLAHCGWRGTLAGLAAASVQELLSNGSSRSSLVAAIGPGISADSFEVGSEVLDAFPARFHRRTSWGTPSIDLAGFLDAQLRDAGVQRVDRVWIDTFENPSWHSYRRDGEHSGRNATICIVDPSRTEPVLNHGEIP